MNNKLQNNAILDSKKGVSRASIIFRKQEVFLAIVMVVLGVIVTIVNPLFLSLQNFFNIVLAVSITGIATIGLALVLIAGEFDLVIEGLLSDRAHLIESYIIQRECIDMSVACVGDRSVQQESAVRCRRRIHIVTFNRNRVAGDGFCDWMPPKLGSVSSNGDSYFRCVGGQIRTALRLRLHYPHTITEPWY